MFVGFYFNDFIVAHNENRIVGTGVFEFVVFEINAAHRKIHSVADLGFFCALFECCRNDAVEIIQNLRRLSDVVFVDDLIESVVTNDTHKGSGNAVSGTIHYSKKYFVLLAFDPVKIAGDDVFWFVQHKRIPQMQFEDILRRKNRFLYSFGVNDTIGDVLVLFLDYFFLFYHLSCPLPHFVFEVLIQSRIVDCNRCRGG